MTPFVAATLAAAIVLALGLGLARVLRSRAAALRHAILAAAVVAALVMPVVKLVSPQLPVIRWHEPAAVSSGLSVSSGASGGSATGRVYATPRSIPWVIVFGAIWATGAIGIGTGLVTSLVRLSRIKSRCAPVEGRWRELTDELARQRGLRRRVAVLQSDSPYLLVTSGVLKAGIILPAGASAWPEDRRRSVLRHELAHIARHDAAIQMAGELLRLFQWINPLVWIVCRRLRDESEYACDDAVLRDGIDATEYARHLLEVAKNFSGRDAAWASAPGIVHPSTLERRIVAMLQHQQNRTALSGRDWLAVVLVALGVSVPIGAAGVAPTDPPTTPLQSRDIRLAGETPPGNAVAPSPAAPSVAGTAASHTSSVRRSAQARGSIVATLVDQLGGTLPGVTVIIDNATAGIHTMVLTDPAGRFSADNIPAGQYDLRASLPGFKTLSTQVTLNAGDTLDQRITLPLGVLQETVAVACSAPRIAEVRRLVAVIRSSIFPVVSAQEQAVPVRVGGNVRVPMKLTDVKPLCPSTVPDGETHVRLTGHIGTDGRINDATLTDPAIPPPADLVDRAVQAVGQWIFTPALLDGQPIAVEIAVDVIFKRA